MKNPETDEEAQVFAAQAAKKLRRIAGERGTSFPEYVAALDEVRTLDELHAALSISGDELSEMVKTMKQAT